MPSRRTFLSAALAALSTPFGLWNLRRKPVPPGLYHQGEIPKHVRDWWLKQMAKGSRF